MAVIAIKDLSQSDELDREAMRSAWRWGPSRPPPYLQTAIT
jgi:hypothetical protein